MKKLLVLASFVVFGLVSVNAQSARPAAVNVATTAVAVDVDVVAADEKPAKPAKKSDKHCADKKDAKCAPGAEKKACCSHGKKEEAKKEENK